MLRRPPGQRPRINGPRPLRRSTFMVRANSSKPLRILTSFYGGIRYVWALLRYQPFCLDLIIYTVGCDRYTVRSIRRRALSGIPRGQSGTYRKRRGVLGRLYGTLILRNPRLQTLALSQCDRSGILWPGNKVLPILPAGVDEGR